MSDAAWKSRERKAAAIFGASRSIVNSGSSRQDADGSDCDHPRIYLEVKLRVASAARNLWLETAIKATKRKKTPVVALAQKHKQGFILVLHEDHLPSVVREWLASRSDDELLLIGREVRVLRGGEL